MKDETTGVERAWDAEYECYTCLDRTAVLVPHRSANIRELDKTVVVPKNMIRYRIG